MGTSIKKKDATIIINSLLGGVVPKKGIQHILIGREDETESVLNAIQDINNNGSSLIKFWIGDFGSGKSFMLHLINTIGLKQNFVVTNADFTPERRLYSNDKKSLALYTEIIKNISVQSKADGLALSTILDNWIEEIVESISIETSKDVYEILEKSGSKVLKRTKDSLKDLKGVRSFEFKQVLLKYAEAYVEDNDDLKEKCTRWLAGEYTAKTDSKNDLGVREIINDSSFYDALKLFSTFFRMIGYSGFIINLDEAINLYKISNSSTRSKNYEKLLSIYNDCLQGSSSGIFLNIAGTEGFLEDERKGLYSYNALKTRLETNKFESKEFRDYSQPVIKLIPLSHSEILVLLQNLKSIFEVSYEVTVDLDDSDIKTFMEYVYNQFVSSDILTPRDIIKYFLNMLNIIRQNDSFDLDSYLKKNMKSFETNTIDEL